ncbi:MAG: hypothetical protein M5U28_03640 [Sandaracinaceae bacterium]|nr:hypothetical protein [Sandaracinaceae bacterium]
MGGWRARPASSGATTRTTTGASSSRSSPGSGRWSRPTPDKLAALCAKLEQLLESFGGGGRGPQPAHAPLRGRARRPAPHPVYRASGALLGMDAAAWEERIGDLTQRGLRAFEESDAGGWRRVYNEAQALLETAGEQEFSKLKLDDPASHHAAAHRGHGLRQARGARPERLRAELGRGGARDAARGARSAPRLARAEGHRAAHALDRGGRRRAGGAPAARPHRGRARAHRHRAREAAVDGAGDGARPEPIAWA